MVWNAQSVIANSGLYDATHQSGYQRPAEVVQDYGIYVNATSMGADPSGTVLSGPIISNLIARVSALGGGTVGLDDGVYLASQPILMQNNVRLIGSNKNSCVIKATIPDVSILSIPLGTTQLSNVLISDISFNCNNLGVGITLNAQLTNVSIERCAVVNAVKPSVLPFGWPLSLGAIFSNAPGSPSTNVSIINCVIGPNAPFLENCMLLNCINFRIIDNVFQNVTGLLAGGLAIYAYCRSGIVKGNVFYNNGGAGGFDCYIQQSDTIIYTLNTHYRLVAGQCVVLLNNHGIVVSQCAFFDASGASIGVGPGDVLDPNLTTFNSNQSQYPYTQGLQIEDCTFNGFKFPIYIYNNPNTANQVTTNNVTDVDISHCTILNMAAGGFGVTVGGSNVQATQRVEISHVKVTGDSGSGYADGIAVIGNRFSSFTNTTVVGAITGQAGVKQNVVLAANPGSIQTGQWIKIDDGTHGVTEDVYVYTWTVGTLTLQAIFLNNHTSGAAVALSATIKNSAPFANGLGLVDIDHCQIQGASTGSSNGIALSAATQVRLLDNDLTNASAGAGVKIALANGGSYVYTRTNYGYNPQPNPTAPITTPTTGTFYFNNTGVDCYVTIIQATVTGTHLYVNISASTVGAHDYGAQTNWPSVVYVAANSYIRFDFSAGTVTLSWQGS